MIKDQLTSDHVTDRLVARMYKFRSIAVWFWTMVLIALTATTVLMISIVDPHLLHT